MLCLFVVCYNLGDVQSRIEATMSAEPRQQQARIRDKVHGRMSRIVVSRTKADMENVMINVTHNLAMAVNEAIDAERASAQTTLGNGIRMSKEPIIMLNPLNEDRAPGRLAWFGREDLDEAVERRVQELEAEEKINPSAKHGFFLEWATQSPPWPLQKIKDKQGRDTGIIGINAPFIKYYYNSEYEKGTFWRLKAAGHVLVGVSSYEFFPGNATNPYTDRAPQQDPENKKIYAAVDAWLHCFQHPNEHIAPGIPRALISQSDFIDSTQADLTPKGLQKKYLFSYSDLSGEWNDFNRNFTVAKECVKIAVTQGMAPVMLIGKKKDENNTAVMGDLMPFVQTGRVIITDMLGHTPLTNAMEESEFFFVPNLSDASPRVAVEALLRGTPLIMNKHIAGGWKYVNDQTGVLFDGADDFLPAIQRLRALRDAGKLRPREWYIENYGPRRASLRLQAFLELAVGKERMAKAKSLVRNRW